MPFRFSILALSFLLAANVAFSREESRTTPRGSATSAPALPVPVPSVAAAESGGSAPAGETLRGTAAYALHAPATAPPDRTSAAATREEADTLDITTWEYLCRYRDSTGGGISHPDTLCISVAGIRLHTLESVPALGRGRSQPPPAPHHPPGARAPPE